MPPSSAVCCELHWTTDILTGFQACFLGPCPPKAGEPIELLVNGAIFCSAFCPVADTVATLCWPEVRHMMCSPHG